MLTYEHVKQPKGGYCLPTSTTIALNAFGDRRFEVLELAALMNTKKKGGTQTSTAVNVLMSLGYDVTWYCGLRHFDVISTIHTLDQNQLYEYLRKRFKWVSKTITNGATFYPYGATLWSMADTLSAGGAVITNVDAYMVWKRKLRRTTSHAVIVEKIDFATREVSIIDPAKGRMTMTLDVFETVRTIDRSTILIYRKAACGS